METHLWHKYAAGLATLRSFFFLNQITMETVQKGRGVGVCGGTWAFCSALAKIHSKNSNFIQNI